MFGYFISAVVVISMATILLHERGRIRDIENEMMAVGQVQHYGNTIHRHITILATYGETALAWDAEDYAAYRSRRLLVDSMMQVIQGSNGEFVSRAQIDTLRLLLKSKEEHLRQIMQLFRERDEADSLLLNHLPVMVRQAAQPRTVTRKKKGIAGWFGAKESVQLPPNTAKLNTLNKELLSMQAERLAAIDTYTDSLRVHNKELNRKLRILINAMNDRTERLLEAKANHLLASYERSVCIITWLIISAIILLVISYLIIQRDLWKRDKNRKRLEETIEQNNALLEMRKNIILTISHDIRTPLNIIGGNAELAMDTREKKRRNAHLNNIRTMCKHVVHLLNNLLDVYRLNEAKETRNDVPFDLDSLLERTVSGFSHIVNNKGILFCHDFKGTDVKLYGDADRIGQIIDNLLSNAVKFTEAGTISLNACYHEGELLLEVKDTGIGMSEDTLSRIFRPFERLSSVANAQGFGLGLPITKGLVNLLGGTINVTSCIDQGSTFRVTLPMKMTNEPIEGENRIIPHPVHLLQSVLVIDDDTMLQDVIKEMLERNGMNCTTCATSKEVVKAMRGKDYDLLLSDIQMPGTNGFELLTLLRNSNIGNSRTIPVIAMTARGDRDKEAFHNAGFTDCIYKPFSSSELLSLLSTVKRCRKDDKGFDFSAVLSEVNDKVKLLRSIIDQSKRDIEELDVAGRNGDREKLRETAHRMQPMWELLQMEETLLAYRSLLRDDSVSDDVLKEHTCQIMDCVAALVAESENEINRQMNETEDTDS